MEDFCVFAAVSGSTLAVAELDISAMDSEIQRWSVSQYALHTAAYLLTRRRLCRFLLKEEGNEDLCIDESLLRGSSSHLQSFQLVRVKPS